MNNKQRSNSPSIIIKIARVFGIIFAAFISLFALDVFTAGTPFWQFLVALFMHLIPTFILAIVIWIAWKHPLIGGSLFFLAGLGYIFMAQNEVFITYVLIAGIPMLIGLMFLAGTLLEKKQAA